MRSILIVSFSRIASDPRVMRQVRLLEHSHSVTVAGFGAKPDARIEYVEIPAARSGLVDKAFWAAKLFLRRYESYYWQLPKVRSALKALGQRSFDVVLANDASALPVSLRLSGGAPVLFDAHEYSPREFDDKWWWRILFGGYYEDLCERYLGRVAAMTTVCQGIAEEYAVRYGVQPFVVYNSPMEQDLHPTPVEPGKVRLVHHGNALRARRMETMIEMMRHLDDRFSLDFMLMPNDAAYLAELRHAASGDPRIRFIPPVPMPDICTALNPYDVGVYLLPPDNFNHIHALPNKFFEFIQARLAVAIGPSPEMARLLREHSCGVTAESFEPRALAATLSALTSAALQRLKTASHDAARALSYERSAQTLLDQIDRIASSASVNEDPDRRRRSAAVH
jgi:hypothetical protein